MYLGSSGELPARQVTVKEKTIPLLAGRAGTRQTLKLMAKIVKADKKKTFVRDLALSLIQNLPQKSYKNEVNALFNFVRDKLRYVRDINGVETLHDCEALLQYGQGDCDDKSILLASLLESIGHPARFMAVSFDGKNFSHVLVQSKIGKDWISLETTEPWEMGVAPPNIKKVMIQNI